MPREDTYFAIVNARSTVSEPAGIARRVRPESGGFHDEALRRSLEWGFTSLIVSWERAESSDELVEVSGEEAERIIEQLRRRWADLG